MTESPVCSNNSEASKLAPQSDVESSSPSRPKIVSANADDRQQSIVGSVDVPVNNKMEIVFSLLSMLSTQGRRESSETFLRMSKDAQHCVLLRESGCLALIIRLLHPSEVSAVQPTSEDVEVFHRASEALRNIARFQKEKTAQHRELKILRCLEKIRLYVLHLRFQRCTSSKSKLLLTEKEVLSAIASLMKWSFEEDNRSATCFFGGLESICEALIMDQLVFKTEPPENHILCRKYIGMTLTNLTFGAARSKQVLCGNMNFLRTVNEQIRSNDDDLKQVFASVLRNLSWKAEDSSKAALQQNHTVSLLTEAAMRSKKEATLKSILSALWNLTSHCAENQMEVCTVPQAVQFLALTLKRSTAAGNNAIVENCGGILRNISACIADREEWRSVLRQTGCYQVLMEHLGAKSLTVISNACGALWNLSNSSVQEQKLLCELGAVELLQTLTQSKHALIRLASSATLKNLQTFVQKVANRSIEGEMLRNGSSSPPSRRHGLDEVGQSRTATLRRLFEPDSRLMINSKESLESPLTVQTTDLMEPSFSGPSLVDQESTPPMETLKRFAVEGTPAHLSRRSSLTSLHQGLVQEESCKAENGTKMDKTAEAVVKKEQTAVTVVSAKAMKTGDGSGAIDVNGGDGGGDSSGGGVGGGSGDVGDGVRVEVCGSGSGEGVGGAPVFTPMMFSRHSSLQSLNSCELQSIHSTVYSEYSYYPTALVSPSDIPDSPGQSALVSPSLPADGSANKPLLAKGDDVFDLPRIYNYEGSSRGGLSAASSLSALTIDVETKVKPAAAGFDLLDLKSCIQSAQPNKSTSVIQRSLNRKTPAVSTQQFEQSNSSKPAYDTAVGDEVVKSFADEGSEIQQAPNSPVTDIHSLIQLAMPKPKSSECATAQLRSASAARAKSNKAKNSSTTDNSSNTSTGSARRVQQQQQQQQLPPPLPQEKKAAETRSASQSSATSGTSGNTSKGSVPRSELRECIYSAFPKPHARRKNRPAEPRNPNTQANRSNTERPTTTNYTSSVSQPKLIS